MAGGFPSNVWEEMIEVRNIMRTDLFRDLNILQDILKVNGGLAHVSQILPELCVYICARERCFGCSSSRSPKFLH